MNNSSAELREWAARCEDKAASAASEAERASLLRKCEALRALADSEDWLTGKSENAANAMSSTDFQCSLRSLAAE